MINETEESHEKELIIKEKIRGGIENKKNDIKPNTLCTNDEDIIIITDEKGHLEEDK